MLKSKKDKRGKTKHPCSICSEKVTEKLGIQCTGACKQWVHFSCLNYSPSKILAIQSGDLQIKCPCPNCENEPRNRNICSKAQCPANKRRLERQRSPIPNSPMSANEVQHMTEAKDGEESSKCARHRQRRSSSHELRRSPRSSPHRMRTRDDEDDMQSIKSEVPPMQQFREPQYIPQNQFQHQQPQYTPGVLQTHTRQMQPTQLSQSQLEQSQFAQSQMPYSQMPQNQTPQSEMLPQMMQQQMQPNRIQQPHLPTTQLSQQSHNLAPQTQHYQIPRPLDAQDMIFPTQDLRQQPQHQWAATNISKSDLYNSSRSYESTIRLDGEEILPMLGQSVTVENHLSDLDTQRWKLNGEFSEDLTQDAEKEEVREIRNFELQQDELELLTEEVITPQAKRPVPAMYASYPDILTSMSPSHMKPIAPHYHFQPPHKQQQAAWQIPYDQHPDRLAGVKFNLNQFPQKHQYQQPNLQQMYQPVTQNQGSQLLGQFQPLLQPQLQQQPYQQLPIPYHHIPQHIRHQMQKQLQQQIHHQVQQQVPPQQVLSRPPMYQQPVYQGPLPPQYVQIPQYQQPTQQYMPIPQHKQYVQPTPQYHQIPMTPQSYQPQLYQPMLPQNMQPQQMYQKYHYGRVNHQPKMMNEPIVNRTSHENYSRSKSPSKSALSFGDMDSKDKKNGSAATPITPATPLTPDSLLTPKTPLTPATPLTPTTPLTPATPLTPMTPLTPATMTSQRDDASLSITMGTSPSRKETLSSLSFTCFSASDNNIRPAHPSKSDSQVTFVNPDRRKVLLKAMEQMYESMGHFHTQFRDLMCRMMTVFEDRP